MLCRHCYYKKLNGVGVLSYKRVMLMALLLTSFLFPLSVSAQDETPTPLLRESIVKENGISANHQYASFPASNLMDPDKTKVFFSGSDYSKWTEGAYIEVELETPLTCDDPNHLLIYLRRSAYTTASPTAFRVQGFFQNDPTDETGVWEDIFYVYFLYRGQWTHEYSSKVAIKKCWRDVLNPEFCETRNVDEIPEVASRKGKVLTKMRFWVTANYGRDRDDESNYRDMGFAQFDVIRLDPAADYSEIFKDRFHLTGKNNYVDYQTTYETTEFVNTCGFLDEHNKLTATNGFYIVSDSSF